MVKTRSAWDRASGRWRRENSVHLAQGASDLCPDSVDVIVEGLEGKDLELGLLIGEEAQDSGCCDETGHRSIRREENKGRKAGACGLYEPTWE